MFKKILNYIVIVCFFLTTLGPFSLAHADPVLGLPAPGIMVNLSPAYEPAIIKGLTVHKDNPFLFDFMVDVGQDKMSGEPLKKEGEKLIKYFLASLAIPDKDLWVNLSPYEKNRMIPEALGQTEMGRDLLEQDYILKQITASLIYPEKQLGKSFWDKVYKQAQEMYGTTQIPVNTFNKVWITADKADVFEHNQTAFVVGSHLKVMLEEDYLALSKNQSRPLYTPTRGHVPSFGDSEALSPSTLPSNEGMNVKASQGQPGHALASQIIRQIILPQLEKEVNTGKNFANLRQIFNSIILASWYKINLKHALLNQVYADKGKVKGINLNDPTVKQQIYEQYLKAYKKGVFNYIKEDLNTAGATIPRKYFSGGMDPGMATHPKVTANAATLAQNLPKDELIDFATLASTQPTKPDTAMRVQAAQRVRDSIAKIVGPMKDSRIFKARVIADQVFDQISIRPSLVDVRKELKRLDFRPLGDDFWIRDESKIRVFNSFYVFSKVFNETKEPRRVRVIVRMKEGRGDPVEMVVTQISDVLPGLKGSSLDGNKLPIIFSDDIQTIELVNKAKRFRLNRRQLFKGLGYTAAAGALNAAFSEFLPLHNSKEKGEIVCLTGDGKFDPNKSTVFFIHGGEDKNPLNTAKPTKELGDKFGANVVMYRYDYQNSFDERLVPEFVSEIRRYQKMGMKNEKTTVISYSQGDLILVGGVLSKEAIGPQGNIFKGMRVIKEAPAAGGVVEADWSRWHLSRPIVLRSIMKFTWVKRPLLHAADATNPFGEIQDRLYGEEGRKKFDKIIGPYTTFLSEKSDQAVGESEYKDVRTRYANGIGANSPGCKIVVVPGTTHEDVAEHPNTMNILERILLQDRVKNPAMATILQPQKPRLLVAEDDEYWMFLMVSSLEQLYDIVQVTDAQEALRVIIAAHHEGRDFKLALIDNRMAVDEENWGVALARDLDKSPESSDIPTRMIMVTADQLKLSSLRSEVSPRFVDLIAKSDVGKDAFVEKVKAHLPPSAAMTVVTLTNGSLNVDVGKKMILMSTGENLPEKLVGDTQLRNVQFRLSNPSGQGQRSGTVEDFMKFLFVDWKPAEFADKTLDQLNADLEASLLNSFSDENVSIFHDFKSIVNQRRGSGVCALQILIDWIAENPTVAMDNLMTRPLLLSANRQDNWFLWEKNLLREILIRAGFNDNKPTRTILRNFSGTLVARQSEQGQVFNNLTSAKKAFNASTKRGPAIVIFKNGYQIKIALNNDSFLPRETAIAGEPEDGRKIKIKGVDIKEIEFVGLTEAPKTAQVAPVGPIEPGNLSDAIVGVLDGWSESRPLTAEQKAGIRIILSHGTNMELVQQWQLAIRKLGEHPERFNSVGELFEFLKQLTVDGKFSMGARLSKKAELINKAIGRDQPSDRIILIFKYMDVFFIKWQSGGADGLKDDFIPEQKSLSPLIIEFEWGGPRNEMPAKSLSKMLRGESQDRGGTRSSAMITPLNGGIDLNTSNGMQWKVSKDGNGVEMNVDPAQIARIQHEGIDFLSPVILRMTPVTSVWPLVGLPAPVRK